MGKATSLVELILKKWGDDIAGAAKELEEMVGFPESVAHRIATGELPMDPKSVEARWIEQGYGDELYHGSTHDIREFNGLLTNTENDMGQGTYLTDSIFDVSNNYAGEGPDLTNRIQSTAERIEDDLQSNWSHASDFWDQLPGGGSGKLADEIDALAEEGRYEEAAMMAAKAINKGPTGGAIYPVRVKGDGVVSSSDRIETRDYYSEAADDLGYDASDLTDDQMDEVSELAYELEADDWQSVENSARSVASNYGADDVYIEPESTWSEVRDSLGSVEMYNDDGMPVGSGQALAEVLQGEGVKGYRDLDSPGRFAGMASGRHTIMFPGSENQIRSVNAAFDPEYTGSNIMGNADPRLLAGIAAGTAGLLAAPMLVTGGKEEDGPRSAREAGFPELPVYKDPSAPLPEPTAGDIGDSLFTILGMPMAGLQGLVRGAYGLLSGEDLVTAAAEANHMMGGSLLGDIGRPGGDTEEGWDRLGKKVTDVTGDETLGFYAKWVPSLFSPF